MRRYFYRDGYYIPKHCIYGPRKNEGVIFTPYDWWRVNDHLIRWERDRQNALADIAKEEAKRQASLNITKNWENTLASVKTQGDERRRLKKEKIEKEKIDKYNEILENRKLEGLKIMKQARDIMFERKCGTRAIISGIIYSRAILEREKQMELNKELQRRADEKEAIYAAEIKKAGEDFYREKVEDRLRDLEKKRKYKDLLQKQIDENARAMEADRTRQLELEKQDNINMRLETEALEEFERQKFKKREEFSKRFRKPGPRDILIKKQMEMEEKEEDELNEIYLQFAKRFHDGRKAQEQKMLRDALENRERMRAVMVKKLMAMAGKEEARLDALAKEKEEEELRELAEKEAYRKRLLQEMEEAKKEALKRQEIERAVEREANKWDMIQKFKRQEVNQEWENAKRRRDYQLLMDTKEGLRLQWKENEERIARELEEERTLFLNNACLDTKEVEEVKAYGKNALKYCEEHGLPKFPVLQAISDVMVDYGVQWDPEGEGKEAAKPKNENYLTYIRKPRTGPVGDACYLFKF